MVVHVGGQSGRNDRTHAMMIVNRVRLYRRRNGALASWCYYWLTIVSEISWVARQAPAVKVCDRSPPQTVAATCRTWLLRPAVAAIRPAVAGSGEGRSQSADPRSVLSCTPQCELIRPEVMQGLMMPAKISSACIQPYFATVLSSKPLSWESKS